MISGVFSIYHDILPFDVMVSDSKFEDIAIETTDLTAVAEAVNSATIL